MRNNQPTIPGLEKLEIAAARVQERRESLEEQFLDLKNRVLKLEMEISLLRIQLEKEGEDLA